MAVHAVVRRPSGPSVTLVSSCVLAMAGCASSSPSTGDTAPGDVSPDLLRVAVPVATSPEVLSGDEIRRTGAGNVWEALLKLRPLWLRARGGTGSMVSSRPTAPVVYVAGIPYGAPRTLQTMNVDQIRRVEFINASDATTRFGTGHSGGVIWVDRDRE